MDLFTAIARRHSYRGPFTAAPVLREDLIKIVQAGIQAPSACNEQVVSFVIIDDPATLRAAAAIIDRPVCNTAPALIVCLVDHRAVYEEFSFAPEDCAACVENMLLAVTALGYASVWLDGVLRRDQRAERLGQLLHAPAKLQVRIVLPLGVPAEAWPQKPKRAFAERAWFNRYGDSRQ